MTGTEEPDVLEEVARAVVRRGLTAPAILFLESVRPLGFVASQAMLFFGPLLGWVVPRERYDALQRALESRDGVERLLLRIEALDAGEG